MEDPVTAALSALVPGGVTRGSAQAGGRLVRWIEAGSGQPAVLLAAGARDTCVTWAPVLPLITGATRVIAYDRAGLGASDPDPALPTADRQAADLAAVIAGSGAGPCIVAGHSWGGLLAQLLASRHPELVAGLVLVDPAEPGMLAGIPLPLRRLYGLAARNLPSLLLAAGLLGPLTRWQARRTARHWRADPRTGRLLADAQAASSRPGQVLAGRKESLGIAASETLIQAACAAAAFSGIPVVVLSAARGRPRALRTRWTGLQAGVAGAAQGRHAIVPGAGHAIHHDQPGVVAEAILEVVTEVRGDQNSLTSR